MSGRARTDARGVTGWATRAGAAAAGRGRASWLACLLAAALLVVAPASALAKSFSFGPITIRAQVAEDGSMVVEEQRVFRFDGQFSEVHWDIPLRGSEGVTVERFVGPDGELKLTEDPNAAEERPEGRYAVSSDGEKVRIQGFFRGGDGDLTFTLRYKADAAAKRYLDCGELYWKFVGEESDVGAERVEVTIEPPQAGMSAEVKAWAHGPLNGNVSIGDDGVVRLEVDDLPARTFVEARVLYPDTALRTATLIDEPRREEVLAEEARLAEEANEQRRAARRAIALGYGGVGLLAVGALVFGTMLFLRFGREHKAAFTGYQREDPTDFHPAVIGALWRMGTPGDQEVAATMMDLANRGVVTMQKTTEQRDGFLGIGAGERETYTLAVDPSKRGGLDALDAELIDLMFDEIGGGAPITIEDIKDWAKAHPQEYTRRLQAWKQHAHDAAKAKGFFEKGGIGRIVGMVMLGLLVIVVGIVVGAVLGSFGIGALGVLGGVPLLVMAPFMSRRSKEAAELHARYRGLRDYLRDFSRLNEAPPMHVILWERFLVLAVVFGIAEQVIEALRVKAPEVVRDPAFQTAYWWAYAGDRGGSPVGAFQAGVASAASVAQSQMSGGSGGGGGFSGGGGGGGGGGGVGAS